MAERYKPIEKFGVIHCSNCGKEIICNDCGDMPDACNQCHIAIDWSEYKERDT